jgi:hypothetical protein
VRRCLFPFCHHFVSDLLSLEQVPETGRWRFMDVSPKFEAAVRVLLVSAVHFCLLKSLSSGRRPMTNSPKSTVKIFSHHRTLSRSTFTVSSRESLKQTISVHFAAMGAYPLPHGAYCNQRLDLARVGLRRLLQICGILIPMCVIRRMALERRSGTC